MVRREILKFTFLVKKLKWNYPLITFTVAIVIRVEKCFPEIYIYNISIIQNDEIMSFSILII